MPSRAPISTIGLFAAARAISISDFTDDGMRPSEVFYFRRPLLAADRLSANAESSAAAQRFTRL
jgi:hypothetical protein